MTGRTNATGALVAPVRFTVPRGAGSGAYRVFAMDDRSRYPVNAPFVVTGTLEADDGPGTLQSGVWYTTGRRFTPV